MVQSRRQTVDAQNSYVGTVHSAAHVQAASQRNAAVGGQLPFAEVLEKLVHDSLDDT